MAEPDKRETASGDKSKYRLKRSLSERFRHKAQMDQIVQTTEPSSPGPTATLHKVIRSGATASKLSKMIKKGQYDLNKRDSDQQTVLHLASTLGQIETMKLLIKKGCDVNLQDMNGFTPLHCAAISGHLEACRVLLQIKGIDVTLTNVEKTSALHYLVRMNVPDEQLDLWFEVLDMIIEKGIDVNIRNLHGEAPLHSALVR